MPARAIGVSEELTGKFRRCHDWGSAESMAAQDAAQDARRVACVRQKIRPEVVDDLSQGADAPIDASSTRRVRPAA